MNYEESKVETQVLLSGYVFVSAKFLETLRNEYVFNGNDRYANATIFGKVTFFQPATIDDHFCHFAIEKKIVDGREFYRVWFAPVDYEPEFTITMTDIIKAWCGVRHINIDCPITQRILNSLDEGYEEIENNDEKKRQHPIPC
jgi:hypothetical protein